MTNIETEITKLELALIPERDPRLKEPCTPWDFTKDGEPKELVLAMGKVMMNPMAPGIGLSANQVGVQKNVIIMGTDERLIACINPSVDELIGEKELYLEGCLSFPDLWLHVNRHPECIVTYQTVDGELVKKKHMKGLEARVFLHEYDHLLGVTFDERVSSSLSLELAKKRRAKKQRLTAKLIKKASKLSLLK